MRVVHTDGITVHDDGIHWRTPPFQCCVTAASRLCEAPRSEEYKHQKIPVLSTVMGQCAWCNRNPALWLIERVDLGSTDPSCPVRSAVPYMNTFKLSRPSQDSCTTILLCKKCPDFLVSDQIVSTAFTTIIALQLVGLWGDAELAIAFRSTTMH